MAKSIDVMVSAAIAARPIAERHEMWVLRDTVKFDTLHELERFPAIHAAVERVAYTVRQGSGSIGVLQTYHTVPDEFVARTRAVIDSLINAMLERRRALLQRLIAQASSS